MRKFLIKWKTELLLGFGIFALALILRTYNLNVLPIFGDEAIYIRWSQVMRAEPTLRFLPLSDGKQPLFMWSVIPFLKVIADPLIAGRLVSVLTGLTTVFGIFELTNLLYKSVKISLIAALLYAISPFSIFFDRLALADSMLAMFGVWTLLFALLTVRKVRLDTAMLAGFAFGGAMLTKSPATIFAILTPLTFLLKKWPKKFNEKFNKLSVFVFLFTVTFVIAFGMYTILRLGPNFHMIGIRNQDYVYPLSHIFTRSFDPLISHLKGIINYFWLMGPGAIIILIVLGSYIGIKEKTKETLLLLVWGVLPILAVAEFSKTMTARYIYFAVPYIFILAALSLGVKLNHLRNETRSHFGYLTKVLVALFVLHALFIDFQLITNPQSVNLPRTERSGYLEEWTSGYGIKEASDYLREQTRNQSAGRQVVVGTEGYFGTLPDGLQVYLNDLPEIIVIGVGIDINELPNSLKESKEAGNKTYLVINNSRLKAKPEDLGLELLAVYPKAFRKEGSREYNTLGPRESLYLFEVTKVE